MKRFLKILFACIGGVAVIAGARLLILGPGVGTTTYFGAAKTESAGIGGLAHGLSVQGPSLSGWFGRGSSGDTATLGGIIFQNGPPSNNGAVQLSVPQSPAYRAMTGAADNQRAAEARNTLRVNPFLPMTAIPTPLANTGMNRLPIVPAAPDATQIPSADRFENAAENSFQDVARDPVSTFSMDTDTASYGVVKKIIGLGRLPPPDAVRVEEFVNYFSYDYQAAEVATEPFQPTVAVYPAPWDKTRLLLQVGIRTYAPGHMARPKLNLVFLLDTSGSMSPPDRLSMLCQAVRMMLPKLRADDRVSIVTYAGASGVQLDSEPGDHRDVIEGVLNRLTAYGSTFGFSGLQTAYRLAIKNYDTEAVNRVILGTDGDFNVGVTDPRGLEAWVSDQKKSGVYLTAVGVGLDNINDHTWHALAKAGNGISAYAGNLEEARRVLVEDFTANIVPVADDVKVQVEFDPAKVSQYRLIGYETRMLRREDFNNDHVDAGEVGSGKSVTAIYEIVPSNSTSKPFDDLRYAAHGNDTDHTVASSADGELAFLKIRYKNPGAAESRLIVRPVTGTDIHASLDTAPADARFASAVAWFGQILKHSTNIADSDLNHVADLAAGARGGDADGRRAEFVSLVRLAASLSPTLIWDRWRN